MQVRSLDNFTSSQNSVVALGTFDGLHLGHQAVIETACRQTELTRVVFSILPACQSNALLTESHREQLLAQMGVHTLVPVGLDSIRQLSPDEFFHRILLDRLHAKHLVCGFNFRFGKNAAGDIQCLQQLCRQTGITLSVVNAVEQGGLPLSSSRIRQALQQGNLSLANTMLGRAYGWESTIMKGQQLGRQLEFPTINQIIPPELVVPKSGVYAAAVTVNQRTYAGVCNIGVHPTVGALPTPLAETHLLDFSKEIYGLSAQLQLIHFLREEKAFSSVEQLKSAIAQDVKNAKTIFQSMKGDCHEAV